MTDQKDHIATCYVCERHMHVDSFLHHTRSKKHCRLLHEAQGLARHWIKVQGSPSVFLKEDIIRSIFEKKGKIQRIVSHNGAFFIRFLKIKNASLALDSRHHDYKNNFNLNLKVMPVHVQAHRPLEVDVFQVEPENNALDDFRNILSHTIQSIQSSPSSSSFDAIANQIASSILAYAQNDSGSNQVYNELTSMFNPWVVNLKREHGLNVNVRVYVFGSIEIGLSLSRFSDIDVYIDVGSSCLDMLHETTKLLFQNSDKFHDIFSIKGARVPIVKAVHSETDIPIDISFKSKLGWYNTQLIKFYVKYDPRIKTLLAILKIWFKRNELNDTRAFTSYSIYWLGLFYLQQLSPPLIPSVHQLMQFYPTTQCLRWKVIHTEEMLRFKKTYPPSKNTMSLEKLVLGFFQFYPTVDLRDTVICPLLGKLLPRRLFEPENLDQLPWEMASYQRYVQENPKDTIKISSQLCIQDPYDLSHNITKAVTHASLSLLQHHIDTVWVLQRQGVQRRQDPGRLLLSLLEDRNSQRDTLLKNFDAQNENLRLQRLLAACEERKKAREKRENEKKDLPKDSPNKDGKQKSPNKDRRKSPGQQSGGQSPAKREIKKQDSEGGKRSLVIRNSKLTGAEDESSESNSPDKSESTGNNISDRLAPSDNRARPIPVYTFGAPSEKQPFGNSNNTKNKNSSKPSESKGSPVTETNNVMNLLSKPELNQSCNDKLETHASQGSSDKVRSPGSNPLPSAPNINSNPLLQMFSNLANSQLPSSPLGLRALSASSSSVGSPQSSTSSSSVLETLQRLAFHSPQNKLINASDIHAKNVTTIENNLLSNINSTSPSFTNHPVVRNSPVNSSSTKYTPMTPNTIRTNSDLNIESKLQNLKQMIDSLPNQNSGIFPLRKPISDAHKIAYIDVSELEKNLRSSSNVSEQPTSMMNRSDTSKDTSSSSRSSDVHSNLPLNTKNNKTKEIPGNFQKSSCHSILTSKNPSATLKNIISQQKVAPMKQISGNNSRNVEPLQKTTNPDSVPLVNGVQRPPTSLPTKQLTYYINTSNVDKKRSTTFLINVPQMRRDEQSFFAKVNEVLVDYFEQVCRIHVQTKAYTTDREFLLRGTHGLNVCHNRNKLLKEAKFSPPRAIDHTKFQVEIIKTNFLLMNARESLHTNQFIVSLVSNLVSPSQVHVSLVNENTKQDTSQYLSFVAFVQNAFDVMYKEMVARCR